MQWMAFAALLLMAQVGRAATYTVSTAGSSGVGSLRWAIDQANATGGAAVTEIHFIDSLQGKTIRVTSSALPPILKDNIQILGLTNASGRPVLQLDGSLLGPSVPWGGQPTRVDRQGSQPLRHPRLVHRWLPRRRHQHLGC